MKLTHPTLLVPFLLASCADEEPPRPAPIVLECTNWSGSQSPGEQKIAVLRIDPLNQFQTAIQWFDYEEQRWVSPCGETMTKCSLNTNPRFIEEVGEIAGLTHITEINRTTGEIVKTSFPDPSLQLPPQELLRGQCERTTEPVESEVKF